MAAASYPPKPANIDSLPDAAAWNATTAEQIADYILGRLPPPPPPPPPGSPPSGTPGPVPLGGGALPREAVIRVLRLLKSAGFDEAGSGANTEGIHKAVLISLRNYTLDLWVAEVIKRVARASPQNAAAIRAHVRSVGPDKLTLLDYADSPSSLQLAVTQLSDVETTAFREELRNSSLSAASPDDRKAAYAAAQAAAEAALKEAQDKEAARRAAERKKQDEENAARAAAEKQRLEALRKQAHASAASARQLAEDLSEKFTNLDSRLLVQEAEKQVANTQVSAKVANKIRELDIGKETELTSALGHIDLDVRVVKQLLNTFDDPVYLTSEFQADFPIGTMRSELDALWPETFSAPSTTLVTLNGEVLAPLAIMLERFKSTVVPALAKRKSAIDTYLARVSNELNKESDTNARAKIVRLGFPDFLAGGAINADIGVLGPNQVKKFFNFAKAPTVALLAAIGSKDLKNAKKLSEEQQAELAHRFTIQIFEDAAARVASADTRESALACIARLKEAISNKNTDLIRAYTNITKVTLYDSFTPQQLSELRGEMRTLLARVATEGRAFVELNVARYSDHPIIAELRASLENELNELDVTLASDESNEVAVQLALSRSAHLFDAFVRSKADIEMIEQMMGGPDVVASLWVDETNLIGDSRTATLTSITAASDAAIVRQATTAAPSLQGKKKSLPEQLLPAGVASRIKDMRLLCTRVEALAKGSYGDSWRQSARRYCDRYADRLDLRTLYDGVIAAKAAVWKIANRYKDVIKEDDNFGRFMSLPEAVIADDVQKLRIECDQLERMGKEFNAMREAIKGSATTKTVVSRANKKAVDVASKLKPKAVLDTNTVASPVPVPAEERQLYIKKLDEYEAKLVAARNDALKVASDATKPAALSATLHQMADTASRLISAVRKLLNSDAGSMGAALNEKNGFAHAADDFLEALEEKKKEGDRPARPAELLLKLTSSPQKVGPEVAMPTPSNQSELEAALETLRTRVTAVPLILLDATTASQRSALTKSIAKLASALKKGSPASNIGAWLKARQAEVEKCTEQLSAVELVAHSRIYVDFIKILNDLVTITLHKTAQEAAAAVERILNGCNLKSMFPSDFDVIKNISDAVNGNYASLGGSQDSTVVMGTFSRIAKGTSRSLLDISCELYKMQKEVSAVLASEIEALKAATKNTLPDPAKPKPVSITAEEVTRQGEIELQWLIGGRNRNVLVALPEELDERITDQKTVLEGILRDAASADEKELSRRWSAFRARQELLVRWWRAYTRGSIRPDEMLDESIIVPRDDDIPYDEDNGDIDLPNESLPPTTVPDNEELGLSTGIRDAALDAALEELDSETLVKGARGEAREKSGKKKAYVIEDDTPQKGGGMPPRLIASTIDGMSEFGTVEPGVESIEDINGDLALARVARRITARLFDVMGTTSLSLSVAYAYVSHDRIKRAVIRQIASRINALRATSVRYQLISSRLRNGVAKRRFLTLAVAALDSALGREASVADTAITSIPTIVGEVRRPAVDLSNAVPILPKEAAEQIKVLKRRVLLAYRQLPVAKQDLCSRACFNLLVSLEHAYENAIEGFAADVDSFVRLLGGFYRSRSRSFDRYFVLYIQLIEEMVAMRKRLNDCANQERYKSELFDASTGSYGSDIKVDEEQAKGFKTPEYVRSYLRATRLRAEMRADLQTLEERGATQRAIQAEGEIDALISTVLVPNAYRSHTTDQEPARTQNILAIDVFYDNLVERQRSKDALASEDEGAGTPARPAVNREEDDAAARRKADAEAAAASASAAAAAAAAQARADAERKQREEAERKRKENEEAVERQRKQQQQLQQQQEAAATASQKIKITRDRVASRVREANRLMDEAYETLQLKYLMNKSQATAVLSNVEQARASLAEQTSTYTGDNDLSSLEQTVDNVNFIIEEIKSETQKAVDKIEADRKAAKDQAERVNKEISLLSNQVNTESVGAVTAINTKKADAPAALVASWNTRLNAIASTAKAAIENTSSTSQQRQDAVTVAASEFQILASEVMKFKPAPAPAPAPAPVKPEPPQNGPATPPTEPATITKPAAATTVVEKVSSHQAAYDTYVKDRLPGDTVSLITSGLIAVKTPEEDPDKRAHAAFVVAFIPVKDGRNGDGGAKPSFEVLTRADGQPAFSVDWREATKSKGKPAFTAIPVIVMPVFYDGVGTDSSAKIEDNKARFASAAAALYAGIIPTFSSGSSFSDVEWGTEFRPGNSAQGLSAAMKLAFLTQSSTAGFVCLPATETAVSEKISSDSANKRLWQSLERQMTTSGGPNMFKSSVAAAILSSPKYGSGKVRQYNGAKAAGEAKLLGQILDEDRDGAAADGPSSVVQNITTAFNKLDWDDWGNDA